MARRLVRAMLLLVAFGLLAAACDREPKPSPESKLIGAWRLYVDYGDGGSMPWAFSSQTLEFTSRGEFTMRSGGMPMSGRYKLEGQKLELRFDKFGERPIEALPRSAQANLASASDRVLRGVVSPDAQVIKLDSPNRKEAEAFSFQRDPFHIPPVGESKVTDEERAFVGRYRSRLRDPEKRKSAEGFLFTYWELALREDRTYVHRFIYDIFGTWRVKWGKVRLEMEPDDKSPTVLERFGDALRSSSMPSTEYVPEQRD